MAFGTGTVNDFAGATSDLFSGILSNEADQMKASGLRSEAANYGIAAQWAGQNVKFAEESTGIQEAAIQRNFDKAQGKTVAEIAGSGLDTTSGTALDIIRSNAQQGAIAKGTAEIQGSITELGYQEQQQSYTAMQAAANAAADSEEHMGHQAQLFGEITGAMKAATGIATLFA